MFTKCKLRLSNCTYLSNHLRKINKLVLGIESTFNDTAAAVVDQNGSVLGELCYTQDEEHVVNQGVDTRVSQKIHAKLLPNIVNEVMKKSQVSFQDLSAIATATKPGSPFSLRAGLEFSQKLVAETRLPFIPVHHMESHLLTARLNQNIPFPFLTLLASGGHCIICVTQGLGQHLILGYSLDEPPGAVFDKVAREMKIAERSGEFRLNTGADVEKLAIHGDRKQMPLKIPMLNVQNCSMSFSGLQTQTLRLIKHSSEDEYANIAASFQFTLTSHIMKRLHRAILYSKQEKLLSDQKPTLVASGGVMCNSYIRKALQNLCNITDMNLVCPPPKLCSDNGIMIAWTGMEYLLAGKGISEDPQKERFHTRYRNFSQIKLILGDY
uniref:N(6)-L-threonylcarbamoyladenine synthase n=1 Tax=Phallusia mammillata TaxID=59560 RepID=A0A6F9DN81_9ASCI|nr:probable tRNA N6-adenosine threonylcarbamoyltransferase, mitochondrial [Phallusia mammillata]